MIEHNGLNPVPLSDVNVQYRMQVEACVDQDAIDLPRIKLIHGDTVISVADWNRIATTQHVKHGKRNVSIPEETLCIPKPCVSFVTTITS